jgi:hypothetical protein
MEKKASVQAARIGFWERWTGMSHGHPMPPRD